MNLEELAAAINYEHEWVGMASKAVLDHAVRCGELLIEAKKQIRHGEWSGWLDANFDGSRRTAQQYMYVARHPEVVAKAQDVADLTLSGVVSRIAASRAAAKLKASSLRMPPPKSVSLPKPKPVSVRALGASPPKPTRTPSTVIREQRVKKAYERIRQLEEVTKELDPEVEGKKVRADDDRVSSVVKVRDWLDRWLDNVEKVV